MCILIYFLRLHLNYDSLGFYLIIYFFLTIDLDNRANFSTVAILNRTSAFSQNSMLYMSKNRLKCGIRGNMTPSAPFYYLFSLNPYATRKENGKWMHLCSTHTSVCHRHKERQLGRLGGIKRERDEGSEEMDGSALPAAIFSPQMTLRQAEAKLLFQPQRLTFGMQTNPTATNQKRNNLVQIIITRKPQLLYCCISPPPPIQLSSLGWSMALCFITVEGFFLLFFCFFGKLRN